MFSRPPEKFLLTSNILHLYLNTAEHSFLLRDVMHLGWVSMLSAFLFDRMFVVFNLFWLSSSRVCILLVWISVLSFPFAYDSPEVLSDLYQHCVACRFLSFSFPRLSFLYGCLFLCFLGYKVFNLL